MIRNLMLIDDNDLDQTLCARLIKRSGLVGELHGFLMAEEALSFLEQRNAPQIDAILLDINMPRMDGFEFLRTANKQLGEKFRDIPVFMLSTSESGADRLQAQDHDMVCGYFGKPLDTARLRTVADVVATNANQCGPRGQGDENHRRSCFFGRSQDRRFANRRSSLGMRARNAFRQ